MFNRDALFGKKDEASRNEPRSSVNMTPGLGGSNPPVRPQQATEQPSRPDLRFAEVSRPQPPQPSQPRVEEPAGSRLIVGPDIKLRGVEITDCDTLVVEGRVEASMDSRVIHIAESGVFAGVVSIDVAEIHGKFEGELTARKQLVIYSTGRVSGQIRYGKIRIEEGGELSGDVSTLVKEPAVTVVAAPATTVNPTPATAAVPPAPAPAAPAPVSSVAAAPASAVAGPAAAGAAPAGQSSLQIQRPVQPPAAGALQSAVAAATREAPGQRAPTKQQPPPNPAHRV